MSNQDSAAGWTEQTSRFYLEFGRYFVPDRELQIASLCDLVPACDEPFTILELACGEGLLARALLERYPQATVIGLDGSAKMRRRAGETLAKYGSRCEIRAFDLTALDWRDQANKVDTIILSLAINFLDDTGKQRLFSDLYQMLRPGGALLLADVIWPASQVGLEFTAHAYDQAIRQRILEIDGSMEKFEMFERQRWNTFRHREAINPPSRLFSQLKWLEQAGFVDIDVFWLRAGYAIYGGGVAPLSIME